MFRTDNAATGEQNPSSVTEDGEAITSVDGSNSRDTPEAAAAVYELGASSAARNKAPLPARLATLWAVTVSALAVHNLEEWLLDMTGWMAGHSWFSVGPLHGEPGQFALALVIVTAAVFVLATVAVAAKPAWSAEALVCVAYALMINTGSHVVLSMASWSLMPGAITGVLILLPLGLLTVRSLPPVRWTASVIASTVIAALGLVYGSLALAALLTPIV